MKHKNLVLLFTLSTSLILPACRFKSDGYKEVSTVDEFISLAKDNKNIKLTTDLDFSNHNDKLPLPSSNSKIKGEGHKITGLNITASTTSVGLFSSLSGEVYDLVIEDAKVTVNSNVSSVGILAGSASNIFNVTVSGKVDAAYADFVGGIAGEITANLLGCVNNAEVVGHNYVGGIAGSITPRKGNSAVSNNKNYGNISGNKYVGGLFGVYTYESEAASRVETLFSNNCENFGNINAIDSYAGGILAYQRGKYGSIDTKNPLRIDGAINHGAVSVGIEYAGGIVGYTTDAIEQISNCTNETTGAISGQSYIGGIVGYGLTINGSNNKGPISSTTPILSNDRLISSIGGIAGYTENANLCRNEGPVSALNGGERVGGIAGTYCYELSSTTDLNYNSGTITAVANCVGGHFGYAVGKAPKSSKNVYSKITNAENEGTIRVRANDVNNVGGIVGYQESNTDFSCYNYLELVNCKNTGLIYTSAAFVGGILGRSKRVSSFTTCTNQGDINGYAYVGGIAGESGDANGCMNSGTITTDGKEPTADGPFTSDSGVTLGCCLGGIGGMISCATSCQNTGIVRPGGDTSNCVGGIAGMLTPGKDQAVRNNYNSGSVDGSNYVGGIAGKVVCTKTSGVSDDSCSFTHNSNYGSITGQDYVGGLIGYQTSQKFDKSFLGALGYAYNIITILENENLGYVTGRYKVAGIIAVGDYVNTSQFQNNTSTGSVSGEGETGNLYYHIYNYSDNN